MCIKPFPQRTRQRGVTLIELIIFIIVISVGLVGILAVMNTTVRSSAQPMVRKQAMAMADAILEEILAKDATLTLPETDFAACGNRALYVGVQDYACFDGAPATAVIRGIDTLGSTPIGALVGFTAAVAVAPVAVSGVALQRVAVTVTGSGETITLFGYRAAGF
ncbi:prepilin-type N-terminal cleavage/methylation domain-containing protein [Propionivibrio sp.]|uniref:type IV pilus modification PilV family protein n=1 Tax=Propionivibrio sp. TaxID=2212460 RepID=UPI0025FD95E1|nr:prepilin-type N-terminal cleavage/methylation domain-containing protein [Propionivibrio sp.]MBK7355375.1 prepilin-type N-terminal cleavage/methylation domain-containing protein [Propionivibrio sp.]